MVLGPLLCFWTTCIHFFFWKRFYSMSGNPFRMQMKMLAACFRHYYIHFHVSKPNPYIYVYICTHVYSSREHCFSICVSRFNCKVKEGQLHCGQLFGPDLAALLQNMVKSVQNSQQIGCVFFFLVSLLSQFVIMPHVVREKLSNNLSRICLA